MAAGDLLLEARDGNLEAVGAYVRLSAAALLRGLAAGCYGGGPLRVYAEVGNDQAAAVDSGAHIRSHCHRTLRKLPRTLRTLPRTLRSLPRNRRPPSPFRKLAR